MVGSGELRILDARDVPPQLLDERAGGGLRAIRVVCCVEAIEDEHDGYHVLYAVVSVGEVVHGLVLFIDDADASFVGPTSDGFDVFRRFASLRELDVDPFSGFDGGLGVKLGCIESLASWESEGEDPYLGKTL